MYHSWIQDDIGFMKYAPIILGVDKDGYFIAKIDCSWVSDFDKLKKMINNPDYELMEDNNPILLLFKFK